MNEAIDNYAAAMVDHHRRVRQGADAAELAQVEAAARERAKNTIEGIRTKSRWFIERVYNGTMHPQNKQTRALFTLITGLKLPATVKGTWEAVKQWAGPELAAYEAERAAEFEAERAEDKRKADATHAEWLRYMAAKLAAEESIDGNALANLCIALKIEVHPRTIGMIRKDWTAVNSTQGARYPGRNGRKPKPTNTPFKLYAACKAALLAQPAA